MNENEIMNRVTDMCVQSLSPDFFSKWEDVKKELIKNRRKLNPNYKEDNRSCNNCGIGSCSHDAGITLCENWKPIQPPTDTEDNDDINIEDLDKNNFVQCALYFSIKNIRHLKQVTDNIIKKMGA